MNVFNDVVNLYLLTKCDMNCIFCYASKDLGMMRYETACQLIDSFSSVGAKQLSITGGEPLLHPDCERIIDYAYSKKFNISLFTGGMLLNRERIDRIGDKIKWICLSLDAIGPVNLEIGRPKNHAQKVFEVMEYFCEKFPTTRIRLSSVVTRLNILEIEKIKLEMIKQNIFPTLWRIKQMVSTRRAGENKDILFINEDQFLESMSKIKDLKTTEIQIHLASNKSGDIMCIHPNGECTTSIMTNDNSFDIVNLGNIISDFNITVSKWMEMKNMNNSKKYSKLWE